MKEALALLSQPAWRVIDQSSVGVHFPALQSFGIDDTLCHSVGTLKAPATVRTWVHPNTVVLGIQDTRLRGLEAGRQFLKMQGYQVIVRNSGGLAVVLDEGILNLSLILPEQDKAIDINRGYETMWLLIQSMFADCHCQIAAGEIAGSYCPGSYDLSIAGKKFAGISQRRLKNGVAVQIYLGVNGSGASRAGLIKQFYEIAGQGATSQRVPQIVPDVMGSLSELLGQHFTINDVMLRLLQQLKNYSKEVAAGTLNEFELGIYPGYLQRVMERNEKIIPT